MGRNTHGSRFPLDQATQAPPGVRADAARRT